MLSERAIDLRYDLLPGDVFATENPMALGKIINWFQASTNKDGKSKYTHMGVMANCAESIEALWTYKHQNFIDAYKGKDVIVFRHMEMTPERFANGLRGVRRLVGRWYPFYRLPLFLLSGLVPGIESFTMLHKPVCSEFKRLIMFHAGCGDGTGRIFGFDPDDEVDAMRASSKYKLVYEGKV